MDLEYILYNSLVYGGMAFVFSTFYTYTKIQHLGMGALMIALGYLMVEFATNGFQVWSISLLVGFVGFYLFTNWILIKQFPNEKTRDLLSIVFTIGISVFVENMIGYVWGASAVHFPESTLGLPVLMVLFVLCNLISRYMLQQSLYARIMNGISEKAQVIQSLGIDVSRYQQVFIGLLLGVLLGVALLILFQANMRGADSLFFFIKGVGISLLVGFNRSYLVFIGALLYVLLEYVIFIERGVTLAYKESLVLVIILLILLFKPEGLFSFGKRSF